MNTPALVFTFDEPGSAIMVRPFEASPESKFLMARVAPGMHTEARYLLERVEKLVEPLPSDGDDRTYYFRLASSFPCLAPFLRHVTAETYDPMSLFDWETTSKAAEHAIAFLATVQFPAIAEQKRLRFNPARALAVWREEDRVAFQCWVLNPRSNEG